MSKVFEGVIMAAAALPGCKTKNAYGGGAGNDTCPHRHLREGRQS